MTAQESRERYRLRHLANGRCPRCGRRRGRFKQCATCRRRAAARMARSYQPIGGAGRAKSGRIRWNPWSAEAVRTRAQRPTGAKGALDNSAHSGDEYTGVMAR